MKKGLSVMPAGLALRVTPAPAQGREDRTLLNWDHQMRTIINEVSGDRALHAVQQMVPYPRVRPLAEYEAHLRDSEAMARLAREAGFSDIEIESFAQGGAGWNPIRAESGTVAPETRKTCDVYDVAVSICSGSETGDVTPELVDVGVGGQVEDHPSLGVKGKIVLGSAGVNQLQRPAVFERSAVGVIRYDPLHPYLDQDQIGSPSISSSAPQGRTPGFGWSISPRVGHELAARPERGEKLTLRSILKTETFPGEMEIVHAVIPRAGATTQAAAREIPSHMTSELGNLLDQKQTVLEIRYFISGGLEPAPPADVMAQFEAQAKLGTMKLNELPDETKKPSLTKKEKGDI